MSMTLIYVFEVLPQENSDKQYFLVDNAYICINITVFWYIYPTYEALFMSLMYSAWKNPSAIHHFTFIHHMQFFPQTLEQLVNK